MILILFYGIIVYVILIILSYNIYFSFYFTENKNDLLTATEIVKDIYLISYYYDIRFKAIRLILYQNTTYINNITCTIFYYTLDEKCVIKIYLNLSEENTVMNILVFVKTIPFKLQINNHIIKISLKYKQHDIVKRNITVCIGKMINYTAYNMLIQMIESYIYFGVDNFVIYKTSCSEKVNKVLNYYSSKGMLDVVRWENDFDVKYAKRKTYAQRIKLNDCFYRNLYNTNALLMTDLDEVLWPSKENSITDMINNIEKSEKKKHDVYIFRERIFKRNYVDYNDRYIHNIEDCDMFLYREWCDYTWKWPKLFIRNLSKVTSVSIHWVTGFLKNYSEKRINSHIGFIRHTRRLYPYIVKGLVGNWTFHKPDLKDFVIQNNSRIVKNIIFSN